MENSKNQTAVEWFYEEIAKYLIGDSEKTRSEIFNQAKEMEKQHIMDAYKTFLDITLPNEVYEQYYNETFKK